MSTQNKMDVSALHERMISFYQSKYPNAMLKRHEYINNSSKILSVNILGFGTKKKIYFKDNNEVKKREITDIVDETIRLDKEAAKMQNIFAGLNTYLNN